MSAAAKVLRFDPDPGYATGGDAWSGSAVDMTGANRRTADSAHAEAPPPLEMARRIDRLETEIVGLREQVALVAGASVVVVETLAPDLLQLVRPFHVSVEPYEEGFRASFADANLMAFGETIPEAVWNLKDLVGATFDSLSEYGDKELGPGPTRQLAVLRQFIRT